MTAPHISDELPRMLTGEADRDTVLAAAAHLRDCIDCQHELVSALVAHASLTSAHRFAPEIVTGPKSGNFTDAAEASPDLTTPTPLRASDAPLPAIDLAAARQAAEADRAATPARSLPDLSAMFAQVRAEADAEAEAGSDAGAERSARTGFGVRSAQRPGRTRYLVGAAAAAVVVGAAGVVYGVTAGDDSNGTPSGRTVALSAYGVGKTSATAKVGDGSLAIDATSLPKLTGKRYEVWLTNKQRTAMQPVGWIGHDGNAAMTVPNDMMHKYTDVEVSVQDLNADDYTYSGVSVLRGDL